MYHNVYLQNVRRHPVNQQQNNGYAENPFKRTDYKQFNEISPAVNSAIYAYASPIIHKPYEKMSLDGCIKSLRRQGKVEGRDFTIEENGDRPWLNINNEYGQQIFRGEYNGDSGKLIDCGISTYKGNKLLRKVYKDAHGKIPMFEDFYFNNEIPQTCFTKEKFTYYTTPQTYIEYLNKNNINYKIDYDGDEENNRCISIKEYDKNGKKVQSTWWYYGENHYSEQPEFVSRSLNNDRGQEEKRITFCNDRTEVCTYLEKCNDKTYNNLDFDVSSLTDARITYNMSPKEYLSYINNNPFYPYKPNVKQCGNNTCIEEIDSNGNVINSTSWFYENEKLERICRWEQKDENNRRRLDFYKDTTEEMSMSYD